MTKKKRELIEILLENITPDDWPEDAKWAAQDKETLTWGKNKLMFYKQDEPPFAGIGSTRFSGNMKGNLVIQLPELCKKWSKSTVTRDEFMKRWNERNQVEQKTPQQLALEKFGTDWHDNEGVQPVDDEVLIDAIVETGTLMRQYQWKAFGLFKIQKWRIHSKTNTDTPPAQQESHKEETKPIQQVSATDKQIDKIITERGSNYGRFEDGAEIMQQLKHIAHTSQGWKRMASNQREAMDMILHKIGRILNGNPNYADSWIDIEGYSKLISDWLKGESK